MRVGSATESPQLCHFSNNNYGSNSGGGPYSFAAKHAAKIQAVFEVNRFSRSNGRPRKASGSRRVRSVSGPAARNNAL